MRNTVTPQVISQTEPRTGHSRRQDASRNVPHFDQLMSLFDDEREAGFLNTEKKLTNDRTSKHESPDSGGTGPLSWYSELKVSMEISGAVIGPIMSDGVRKERGTMELSLRGDEQVAPAFPLKLSPDRLQVSSASRLQYQGKSLIEWNGRSVALCRPEGLMEMKPDALTKAGQSSTLAIIEGQASHSLANVADIPSAGWVADGGSQAEVQPDCTVEVPEGQQSEALVAQLPPFQSGVSAATEQIQMPPAGVMDDPPASQIIRKLSGCDAEVREANLTPREVRILRIQLRPEDLGNVEIVLRHAPGETRIHIAVSQESTADSLRHDIGQLEERLGSLLSLKTAHAITIAVQTEGQAHSAGFGQEGGLSGEGFSSQTDARQQRSPQSKEDMGLIASTGDRDAEIPFRPSTSSQLSTGGLVV